MVKGIYVFNAVSGHWKDVELTKDCGAVPYLFHRKYGYNAVMVTTKNQAETYPSLSTKVKGLKIEYLSSMYNFLDAQFFFLTQNYSRIDILSLHGAYRNYIPLVNLYRQLRPDGKVYIALDANSWWMNRIDFKSSEFNNFLSQCDVIATSSRVMQQYLSAKWPFKIEYIPNGFYNFENVDLCVDFEQKKNTILTVGRIGTEQKNNQMLLDAFAQIANKIPKWKIKLVGNVEDSFKAYLQQYFIRFPFLRKRIIFTGQIENKADLIREYQLAKIFTMTSRVEGGTPNVIAESLFSGCYQVLTNFDAASEATDNGQCGVVVRDIKDLEDKLLLLCNDDRRLLEGGRNAIDFAKKNYDFNLIIQRLKYLLVGDD